MPGTDPIEIHLISDSTGDTAARVARAAQAQFSTHPSTLVRHPRVTTVDGLSRAFERIQERRGVAVFFTLIDPELRRMTSDLCQREGIANCDLLGPPVDALAAASGDEAEMVPGRPLAFAHDYFKRVAAMEFAVKHDDGLAGEGLEEAEIILIGVSRTGKTPLSMYLGYLGYKTANVPLVRGIQPPAALFRVDASKVVGLTIDPERLQTIRGRRLRAIGGTGVRDGYAELNRIFEELEEASSIQRRLGCPVIDVTNIALEEAANRVIDLVEERRAAS
jgi:[pyruvate, water dikinase]-phosphate phosphotransferase / [pyruvate, water dikinase] kinase